MRRSPLKRVHAALSADGVFNRSFIDEARLGGLLSHPNIVQVLDFGEVDGRLFLAMALVDGVSLEQLLEHLRRTDSSPRDHLGPRSPLQPGASANQAIHTDIALQAGASHQDITSDLALEPRASFQQVIPPDLALQLVLQVCRGLEHAHTARDHDGRPLRVVHRDLKPSNVLLDRHGVARVADFGIARAESNLNATRESLVIKGTARYMSPEQALGMREIDARADLFAVGLLLYELLAGEPFNNATTPIGALHLAQAPPVAERRAAMPG